MSKIFLSYRRDDSAAYAGRLYDRLAAHFGKDRIFMDIDHIEPGQDFVELIDESMRASRVLIVLIGKHWINALDATGARRLDNPDDFVRREVGAALDRKLRVIPVLVSGATMPRAQELPENLFPLVRRQAVEISDLRFHPDVDRLVESIEKALCTGNDHGLPATEKTAQEKAVGQTEHVHEQLVAQRVPLADHANGTVRPVPAPTLTYETENRFRATEDANQLQPESSSQAGDIDPNDLLNTAGGMRPLPLRHRAGWKRKYWILGGIVAVFLLAVALRTHKPAKLPPASPEPVATSSAQTSEPAPMTEPPWVPGTRHKQFPNVVAGDKQGNWRPAPGYTWVNKDDHKDLRVTWSPGQKHHEHPNVIAGDSEGSWNPAPGYGWTNKEDVKDLHVAWSPGTQHRKQPNVIAGENEGDWKPAPGYVWVSNASSDLRVKRAGP